MIYSVWIEQNGKWYKTDDNLNQLAAMSIENYYKERGTNVKVISA